MMLINPHQIRCDRNDYDTYKDYMTAFNAIMNAKPIDAEPIIRCKDCIYYAYHGHHSCSLWRERAVIVECNTAEDGFCYMGKRKEG